jgi:hypothetical protein
VGEYVGVKVRTGGMAQVEEHLPRSKVDVMWCCVKHRADGASSTEEVSIGLSATKREVHSKISVKYVVCRVSKALQKWWADPADLRA